MTDFVLVSSVGIQHLLLDMFCTRRKVLVSSMSDILCFNLGVSCIQLYGMLINVCTLKVVSWIHDYFYLMIGY